MATGVGLLLRLWEQSGRRLRDRCRGLTDDELLWEPVADCWNLRPDESHVGGWSYDYDFAPPEPAPMTTIGWRLVHVTAGNLVYWDHAFGPGTLAFPDLVVPHTADSTLAAWHDSRLPITAWLTRAGDAEMAEPRPSHLPPGQREAGDQVRTLIDEQIHHGAEIALLRDLYRHQRSPTPDSSALSPGAPRSGPQTNRVVGGQDKKTGSDSRP